VIIPSQRPFPKVPGRDIRLLKMHDTIADRPENPREHVIEMHIDIGGDAYGFVDAVLPRSMVPVAARRQIGQIDSLDLGTEPGR
jgi:hypothetical protein